MYANVLQSSPYRDSLAEVWLLLRLDPAFASQSRNLPIRFQGPVMSFPPHSRVAVLVTFGSAWTYFLTVDWPWPYRWPLD